MKHSPLEKYCAALEQRAGDNKTISTLVAILRVQRTALEDIRFRCDTDVRKANGSALMQSRAAIEFGDKTALERMSLDNAVATGVRSVWSHPDQPSDA